MLAPEDDLLLLAIQGGRHLWGNAKLACDVAAHIASHGELDWRATFARARDYGALRILLVAVALAQVHFGTLVPEFVAAAIRADPVVNSMIQGIATRWRAEGAG